MHLTPKKGDWMHSTSIQAIMLAAGKSKRFNTGGTKLLEKLCGQEMILYPAKLFAEMDFLLTVVVGYQAEQICNVIETALPGKAEFIEQKEQLGTGHALMQTQPNWQAEHMLITNGDCPLISRSLTQELIDKHFQTDAGITFVTAHHADLDNKYGRVIVQDSITKIIEASEFNASNEECCINAGLYLIKTPLLKKLIHELKPHATTGEIYITDLIELASKHGYGVETISAPFDSVRGINTPKELWTAEHIKRSELISYWMDKGVIFSFAQSTHIDVDVTIGTGSRISAGAHILRGTKIGSNCHIGPFTILDNVQLNDNVSIESHCVLQDSIIGENVQVGPFARIRNHSIIGQECVIGNFVEVTQSILGKKTKSKHLTYLGNAVVGEEVNIGAGTITCNYNGFSKKTTTIQDSAFIGSNNTIVAPVTIEKQSYTAAGSVITKDVPEKNLAIARTRQINKEGYAERIKERNTPVEEDQQNNSDLFWAARKTINDTTKEE